MISVHHLECSRSFRILWALEELGLDYDIHFYQRLPNYSAPETLKCIHPLGKAPLEYLQQRYDQKQQFKPKQAQDLQQYIYWMHYAEGSLMPLLVMTLVMNNVNKHVPWLIQPVAKKITEGVKANFVRPRMKDHISFLENYLAEHE
ncbi:MAG: glutathione S-transferase, partial [Acinetobacter baumannii]|nr:glutathione S-transferase [Acinetobacter baumannii]